MKCRELQEIVVELRSHLGHSKLPLQGGNRPLYLPVAQGLSHKVSALWRVIDRFGAYLAHLIALGNSKLPLQGGNRPLYLPVAQGLSHKVSALWRVIDRFGAYLAHLTALTEDTSVTSSSRQKLKGESFNCRSNIPGDS